MSAPDVAMVTIPAAEYELLKQRLTKKEGVIKRLQRELQALSELVELPHYRTHEERMAGIIKRLRQEHEERMAALECLIAERKLGLGESHPDGPAG